MRHDCADPAWCFHFVARYRVLGHYAGNQWVGDRIEPVSDRVDYDSHRTLYRTWRISRRFFDDGVDIADRSPDRHRSRIRSHLVWRLSCTCHRSEEHKTEIQSLMS